MLPLLPPSSADTMLGRLATWLRLVGADVVHEREIAGSELLRRAGVEERLVLTRDTGIMARNVDVPRLFIRHDRLADQLRQVADAFDITCFEPFSRCLRCNEIVVDVDRDSVRDRVWPYVYETNERFRECPGCRRLYWSGTHPERAYARLTDMLGADVARAVFRR